MAKRKSSRSGSRAANNASPKVLSTGLIVALGVACAGGAGYFFGKKGDASQLNLPSLIGLEKSAPAAKTAASKAADSPHLKPGDKTNLAKLLKGDGPAKAHESKTAEARDAEPRPPADIPTPPAKPELARAEAPKPDAAAPDAQTPEPPERPVLAAKPEQHAQPAPLAFALLDREVSQNPFEQEQVTLSLNFENLAGKPIRAFEGVVKFTDPNDNNIYSSAISVSALISEGGALRWDQHVDPRKLVGKSRRLISEDKANLRAVFLLKKVFFVDGSVQKYAMPPRAAQAG
jgi:hypothetical protein